jgi:hypothetical protein
MRKKTYKPLRMLPLVEGEIVPIIDPDEIAALEGRIRAAEKAMAAGHANGKKAKPRKKK